MRLHLMLFVQNSGCHPKHMQIFILEIRLSVVLLYIDKNMQMVFFKF